MNELAYNSHLRCVTLAQTLIPRNLTSLKWYVASSAFVQQYRASKEREEEAINGSKTDHIRAELEPVLIPLKKAAEGCIQDFLEYIYANAPTTEGQRHYRLTRTYSIG